jgi:hypothetical protein
LKSSRRKEVPLGLKQNPPRLNLIGLAGLNGVFFHPRTNFCDQVEWTLLIGFRQLGPIVGQESEVNCSWTRSGELLENVRKREGEEFIKAVSQQFTSLFCMCKYDLLVLHVYYYLPIYILNRMNIPWVKGPCSAVFLFFFFLNLPPILAHLTSLCVMYVQ